MSASSRSEVTRQAARALATDLVLRAGAGTGKTWTLVDVAVHLVGRGVAPGRLLALTFGEKAAAELRERIRRRLEALAAGKETLETAAAPMSAAEWRRAAAVAGAATVTTFHAFAASLLRRHAASAGVDPAFGLLDEEEALALLRTHAEEAVLAALGERDVRELVRELDFSRGPDGRGRGLVEHVIDVACRLAEEGRAAGALATIGDDREEARRVFDEARRRYVEAVGELRARLEGGGRRLSDRLADLAERLRQEVPRLEAAALGPDADPAAHPTIAAIERASSGNLGNDGRSQARARAREALMAMREAHVAWRAAPLAATFAALVGDALRRYGEAKAQLGALDFTDLIVRARDLLRDDEAVRAETQARFEAVLVDEFQDTNELQDELVELARGPGVPRLVVGDPKQSIYEFRGADVSVFGRVAAQVAASGGQVLPLTESRRGRRPLVELVNRLFARAMRGGAHPFEIAFDPEADALEARRGGEGACVELLDDEGGEPAAVARAIRALVDERRPVVVDDEGAPARAARYGDVAILLRRFTRLDAFLGALRRAGVPHHVVNGRGFHEAQEVRDLCHALALVDDPDDALALLGVLRSPLVGLSDASLVALAELDGRGRLALGTLLADGLAPPPDVPADEAARLRGFLALYLRLRRHADRLGAAGLLRALVDETDLGAVLATTWYGEQRVANLERLLAQAAEHDERGRGDRLAFARRLRAQVERERSLAAPAQVLGEKDDVVRVMTIHQAKGLEFPVVVVPECGVPERDPGGSLAYDRAAGLGFRLRGADGGATVPSLRGRRVEELRRARTRAESLRLFYVATTRARDLLLLGGAASRSGETWRRHLDELLAEDEAARALVRAASATEAPPPTAVPSVADRSPSVAAGEPVAELDLIAHALAAAAVAPPRTGAQAIVAPVTELADFDACARRYLLRHEVGLVEFGRRDRTAGGAAGAATGDGDRSGDGGELDALERGTLAHRLLERIDLAAYRARGAAAVDALVAAEGLDPHTPGVGEVRRVVLAFLGGAFGRALAARAPHTIAREEPFALAVGRPGGPRLLVKGQMDLVLFDEDAVTVLDYKLSRGDGGHDYRFQLLAYAAAARAIWGRPARVGLVHLLDRAPRPRFVDASDRDLDACLERLARIAAELAIARRTGRFAGRPVETCRALRCGYVGRCHPASAR